ncbi:MAG: YbaB/EbfC family nucleoid-associated protein [Clostridia bacterium]|nr:YbaB/EbfC family nucleoid-associated protein [Clostridia bacterium]
MAKGRFPMGNMGGMGNLNNMMKQAQKMQEEMQKTQEALADKTVEASVGGGAVTVSMNGHKQLLSVNISPDVVDPDDVEMLQDLILSAVNEAMRKAEELAAQDLGKITGGLNIPGLF